jgi:glycerol-3-phosphate cytidylyltransferase-like family protein
MVRHITPIIYDLPSLERHVRYIGTLGVHNIALSHGCFDLCHIGHIAHFRYAKTELSNPYIIASLSPDSEIEERKGKPHFSQQDRALHLAELRDLVDLIFCNSTHSPLPVLAAVHPTFYLKGPDIHRDKGELFEREKAFCTQLGISIVFTEGPEFHSSELVMRQRIEAPMSPGSEGKNPSTPQG